MKRNLRIIFSVLIYSVILFFSNRLTAQTKAYIKAEKLFNAGAYYDAEVAYRDAYGNQSEKTNKGDIQFKIGECFRLVNEPARAELWYIKAISKKTTYTQVYFYLAEMQKMREKYEDAKESYRKYKELEPNDPRADEGIKSCEFAQKMIESPNGYIVENIKFFNSKHSDYTPAYAAADNGTVFFTSHRESQFNKSKNPVTGEPNAHIYFSKIDKKGAWSDPLQLAGSVNSDFEEGNPNLSKDFKTLYFTRCDKLNKLTWANHIYSCSVQGEDYWDPCKKLEIAADSVSVGSPAISPDNLTLYFTSDMKGSVGGKDIWKITRSSEGDKWSEPVNLGPQINTKGDECFPYVHPDGTLYFSSNGLQGMGGLDIFKAKQQADGTWKAENMGYPLNSSSDDWGITFQQENEKGFFSSCRTPKNDPDIFAFVLPPLRFNIMLTVKDERNDKVIPEAVIKTISSDGVTSESKADKNGVFRMPLKPNIDYVIIASANGFLNGKIRETTKGLDRSKDLKPIVKLASYEKPIELPNIAYDFAKWDLRPESKTALDKLVETLNDNPTIIIELMSHTDARGSETDNQTLSQKRAQSVVDYLLSKGIAGERMQAKGYGESNPKVVDKKLAEQYTFLKEGETLTEAYIGTIADPDMQEMAHQINRRTEFKVLSADYKPRK